MSEEQYKIEKGFLANEGMSYTATKATYEYLSKFKTYLIEQGECVASEDATRVLGKTMVADLVRNESLTKRIKELEKEVQQHRDNAFKVVSEDDIDNFADDTYSKDFTEGIVVGAKWMQDKLTGKV